ncbi:pentapeptide repeat-containing protein [Pseudodesulfovibrio pelocollis]|uniref:pentapeptide repeat-containing protein n=1 Tax=Pseudodesulfovibrio pelocollis TaxID=3051432 RepID=UPI003CE4D145
MAEKSPVGWCVCATAGRLGRTSLDRTSLDRTSLDRASLDRASLDRASLDRASLGRAPGLVRAAGPCLVPGIA